MTSVYCVRVKERDEGMCACVYFRLYVYDCVGEIEREKDKANEC